MDLLTIHLLCAGVFGGYLLLDLLIFARIKPRLNPLARRAFAAVFGCICGAAFCALCFSGAQLAWLLYDAFSPLAKAVFVAKMALFALMLVLTICSIALSRSDRVFAQFARRKQLKAFAKLLINYSHEIALILIIFIILLAKLLVVF